MDNLRKLLEMLEDKLAYTKQLIDEYDETMDYASHSNLMGFAEGIEFVMEEIEEALEGKARWASRDPEVPRGPSGTAAGGNAKRRGAVTDRKAKGMKAKDKNRSAGKSGTAGKSKSKDTAGTKGKNKGKGRGRA